MRGYDPADWEPFFAALIAAAAALTGLLFVAVSINLDKILKRAEFLPARSAETMATLLFVVVSTLAGLSLAGHWGGGVYWLAASALLGIVGASYSAWVLLVEIVR